MMHARVHLNTAMQYQCSGRNILKKKLEGKRFCDFVISCEQGQSKIN